MDAAAARPRLKTTDGEKLTVLMMRRTGRRPLGNLGGGEAQDEGMRRWRRGSGSDARA